MKGRFILVAACAGLAYPALGQVVIEDTEFSESDWTHVVMWSMPTATLGPMTQQLAGGNHGAYQRGRHVTQGAFAAIWDGHFFEAQAYDPATQGAVASVDIKYQSIDFSPGGIQSGLAVRQGTKTYIRYVDSSGPHTAWATLSASNILPNDNQWQEVSGATPTQGAPDFTGAGQPLYFGYYTFNWSLPVGFLIEREWGIDNVQVTVHGAPCYPDCNTDGTLTVADFGCFQTKFVGGDPYADCNADLQLTVADFGCFQTAFVAGCPP